jgi:hypothetical protein
MLSLISLLFFVTTTYGNSQYYEDECHYNCDNNYWTCYNNHWETCYNEAQHHPYVNEECFNQCSANAHACLSKLNCFTHSECYMNGNVYDCSDCVYKCGYQEMCVNNVCHPEIEACHAGCPPPQGHEESDCVEQHCNNQINDCINYPDCFNVVQQIEQTGLCDIPEYCFNADNQFQMCNQNTECQQHFSALASCFEQHCYAGTASAGGESSYYEESSYYDSGAGTGAGSSYYDPATGADSSYYDPATGAGTGGESSYYDPYETSSYYESSYYDPYAQAYPPKARYYVRSRQQQHSRHHQRGHRQQHHQHQQHQHQKGPRQHKRHFRFGKK